MTDQYNDAKGNFVMMKKQIVKELPNSLPCEACDGLLTEHDWIAIDINGLVAYCSKQQVELPNRYVDLNIGRDDFTHYVAYNAYGGVERRVTRGEIEEALKLFETKNIKWLGVWELQRSPYNIANEPDSIDVRLSPMFEINNIDNLWHSYNYNFTPEL